MGAPQAGRTVLTDDPASLPASEYLSYAVELLCEPDPGAYDRPEVDLSVALEPWLLEACEAAGRTVLADGPASLPA